MSVSSDRGACRAAARRRRGAAARALGVGRGAIDHWVKTRRLHVWYRGVYAVGRRALKREGRWMAAVLAIDPAAALSHRSAGAPAGIRPSARAVIEVTVDRKVRGPAGIQVHQARLQPDDVTTIAGIPATTAARTLVDLAAVLPADQLRQAIKQTQILRLPYPDRARDRALLVAGWRTIRVTWRRLREQPRALAEDLRTLLDAGA